MGANNIRVATEYAIDVAADLDVENIYKYIECTKKAR